jgi:LacI family transcriptional regulator
LDAGGSAVDSRQMTWNRDQPGVGRGAGAHLAETGHRRVVVLAGTRDKANVSLRATGFVAGLLAGGVDVQDVRVVNGEISRDGSAGIIRETVRGRLVVRDSTADRR